MPRLPARMRLCRPAISLTPLDSVVRRCRSPAGCPRPLAASQRPASGAGCIRHPILNSRAGRAAWRPRVRRSEESSARWWTLHCSSTARGTHVLASRRQTITSGGITKWQERAPHCRMLPVHADSPKANMYDVAVTGEPQPRLRGLRPLNWHHDSQRTLANQPPVSNDTPSDRQASSETRPCVGRIPRMPQ